MFKYRTALGTILLWRKKVKDVHYMEHNYKITIKSMYS